MESAQRPSGEVLAAISNGIVALHTRFYGKGPTQAKTHVVDDIVICVLWNGFTTVEHTLIEEGEARAVERFRRTFQVAMESQFTDVIEAATGRRVVVYMSQVHADPNVAVELFNLQAGGSERPPLTAVSPGADAP